MKVIMYGTEKCPDCVKAKELLANTDIELDYRNITESIAILKEFLSYRDHEDIFAPIVESGKVGIPFFILADGTKTFELSDFINMSDSQIAETMQINSQVNSCSIDGKGSC